VAKLSLRLWHLIVPLVFLLSCAALGTDYQIRAECDGSVASGTYELVLPDGTVQVTGSFSDGYHNGLFTFYRSTGEKVAEIPYVRGQISGTINLWYGPEFGSGQKKLTTQYHMGQPDGPTASWYPDGSVRERSTYSGGILKATEFRDPNGIQLGDAEARAQVESARDADREYFNILTEVTEDNLPSCSSN
jgi:antitoxin component YwqK of YwqJK toxin-antitoxin module